MLPRIKAYDAATFAWGQLVQADDSDGVTAHWPHLETEDWQTLLAALEMNRRRVPTGAIFWERLQLALQDAGSWLSDPASALADQTLTALPVYTGYSEAMIRVALNALNMFNLERFVHVFAQIPTKQAMHGWQSLNGLVGRVRFYPAQRWRRGLANLMGKDRALHGSLLALDRVVGYGAGNVPGTALLIALLALGTTLTERQPPVIVVRNSRQEPLFAPAVFAALAAIDPDLVSTVAILGWEHDDPAVSSVVLPGADLVIAAASDEAITAIRQTTVRSNPPRLARFHAHGHKVSFSAIGHEMLTPGLRIDDGAELLDVVAGLAALDSIFWDQYGCLSSRIHFVETVGVGQHTPLEYAERLTRQLRLLAMALPRGVWPRQHLHDRFDRYKLLENPGLMRVVSTYDDEFIVAVDERPLDDAALRSAINDCQGRVILVRPVNDLHDVPKRYLSHLPAANLQSLSVAMGDPGAANDRRFLDFAAACGACGVTAIRSVGRGAFPQLAYSWDGLIPLDLVRPRPAGWFTTIEFESPYDDILQTYRFFKQLAPGARR